MNRPLCCAICVVILSGAHTAAADEDTDKQTAKEHFVDGKKLMGNEDYAGAAKAFEKSVDLYPTKGNLYNLANCYKALNRHPEALETFVRAKAEFETKYARDKRKELDRNIEELNGKVARVTVTSTPEDARVVIDGEPRGITPLAQAVVLSPGSHSLEVSLDGYDAETRTFDLSPMDNTPFEITLVESKASLTIVTHEDGAEIAVDGNASGTTPLEAPLELVKGSHTITVSKSGFETDEKTVELAAGETRTLDVNLIPVAAPDPVPAIAVTDPEPSPATPPQTEKTRTRGKGLFIAGLVGTLVAGSTTALMWGMTAKKRSEYVKNNKDLAANWSVELQKETAADRDSTQAFNGLAVLGTVATGVFAVLLVTGAAVKRKHARENPPADISVAPGGIQVSF